MTEEQPSIYQHIITCSDLLAQDSLQRCAEYRQMQETFWKWGKRYDDTALIMALRKGGNEIHGLH